MEEIIIKEIDNILKENPNASLIDVVNRLTDKGLTTGLKKAN